MIKPMFYLVLACLVCVLCVTFSAADDYTWLKPPRQSKLTDLEKHKIELLLAHDIIDRPNYHDISPLVKVIKVPENSPLRRTHNSEKLQLLFDYGALQSPDGRKVLVFSYDESEASRISVCNDWNCGGYRIFCKYAKDVDDAAWFPDGHRIAYTENMVYGGMPGVWIWDSEAQTAYRAVKPGQVNGSRDSAFYQISLSPDGNFVWFVHDPAGLRSDNNTNNTMESWIYSVSQKKLRKLESKRYYSDSVAVWSVDGKRIKIGTIIFELSSL
jgi:hypothetical protein